MHPPPAHLAGVPLSIEAEAHPRPRLGVVSGDAPHEQLCHRGQRQLHVVVAEHQHQHRAGRLHEPCERIPHRPERLVLEDPLQLGGGAQRVEVSCTLFGEEVDDVPVQHEPHPARLRHLAEVVDDGCQRAALVEDLVPRDPAEVQIGHDVNLVERVHHGPAARPTPLAQRSTPPSLLSAPEQPNACPRSLSFPVPARRISPALFPALHLLRAVPTPTSVLPPARSSPHGPRPCSPAPAARLRSRCGAR
ncbi:Hypothetical protein CAP_1415 [Chondromyces apiculatus DSM 436]|uniref:Uncharacterized protein n=1 Tax=Chondromyces apiculatus DSM 436 TaxID=1192034 RepID=A0A017TBQ5_9BACT|nr:Hypothetical protein CAP_1415 [Chondromyces apiculatus DSM 436]